MTRSRHRVIPLEDLWQPLLEHPMPRDLRLRAAGMLRLFAGISRSMCPTSQTPSMNTTPQLEWLSRGDIVHELSASLLIEQSVAEASSGAPRDTALDAGELLPPKKGSAPFRFELQRIVGIDLRRFETVNRLFALAPHFGLALLRLIVDRDIVPADYPNELAGRQRTRISTRDTSLVVYPININAPNAETVATAADAIEDFLMFDDAKIGALAEMVGFPEFESWRSYAARDTDSPTRRSADSQHTRSLAEYVVRSRGITRLVRRTRSLLECTHYSYQSNLFVTRIRRYSRCSYSRTRVAL